MQGFSNVLHITLHEKPPEFDITTGKAKFSVWKSKWSHFLVSSGIEAIQSSAKKKEQKRANLQRALSDDTVRWVDNQNFSEEDREDADFIIERMEAYIKGTTNPLVQVVELLSRKQSAHESCEKFIEDLKERARWCEFGRVVDVQNWFLLSCLCANMYDSEIRAEVIFKKDLTFEKAVEFVLEKEKAAKASRELEQRGWR